MLRPSSAVLASWGVLMVSAYTALAQPPNGAARREAAAADQAPGAQAPTLSVHQIDRATVRVLTIEGIDTHLVRANRYKHWFALPVQGHGSGTIVTEDGLVLTAAHVVEDSLTVFVRMPGSEYVFPAAVVHEDSERDFALLSVHASTPSWVPLSEKAPRLVVRQQVHAVGYPIDPNRPLPQSSRGIVAGVMPDGLLQLSIAVNPGNSGGPLIDDENRLLGIVVARGNPQIVQGVALAVPVSFAASAYRQHAGSHRHHKRSEDHETAALLLDAARLLSGFVELRHDGLLGLGADAWQNMRAAHAERLAERLERARNGSTRLDALVAALLSTYYWNFSVLLREARDSRWQELRKRAATSAHWAASVDPHLLATSRFLRVARRRAIVDYGLAP